MDQKHLRILIVEDNDFEVELLLRALRQNDYSVEYKIVQTGSDLQEAFREEKWDIVFSDYSVSGYGAMEALEDLKKLNSPTPVIIVSGAVGEDRAVEILKAGADDFIVKGKWNRLPAVVNRAIREREIRAASEEARRAREQILAVVSHDLRNPLAAIKLNIQAIDNILARQTEMSEDCQRVRQLCERINSSMDRCCNLVDDILDETQVASGRFQIQPKNNSVNQFIRDILTVFSPLARSSNINLELHGPNEEVTADFDYERLYQAMSNLIANAVKFTRNGGKVTLTWGIVGNNLQFKVKDTGLGIPSKFVPLIFERFWQGDPNNKKGVGLGLFIVRGIINAHNGIIKVTSWENIGTEFTVEIPRNAEAVESKREEEKWHIPDETKYKEAIKQLKPLLLIEDDEDVRFVLRDFLKDQGFEVLEAESLAKATALSNKSEVGLILTDYQLEGSTPTCLQQFIEGMLTQDPELPIILVSGETNLEDRAKAMHIPFYLKKPFDHSQFQEQLYKAITTPHQHQLH